MPFSLMAISDRQSLLDLRPPAGTSPGTGALLAWADRLAEARIPALQLREKELDDRALFELAVALRRRLPATTRLLINGRADVALAAGADGVHLPADSLPTEAIHHRFGDRLLIGCSTHSLAELDSARAAGADYATFGPVFVTPSKERFGPPLGLEALREASRRGLPLLALGGIENHHFPALAAAGAAGAAGIRLFQGVSSNLTRTARDARAAFPQTHR